jgi:hypothetical protein
MAWSPQSSLAIIPSRVLSELSSPTDAAHRPWNVVLQLTPRERGQHEFRKRARRCKATMGSVSGAALSSSRWQETLRSALCAARRTLRMGAPNSR